MVQCLLRAANWGRLLCSLCRLQMLKEHINWTLIDGFHQKNTSWPHFYGFFAQCGHNIAYQRLCHTVASILFISVCIGPLWTNLQITEQDSFIVCWIFIWFSSVLRYYLPWFVSYRDIPSCWLFYPWTVSQLIWLQSYHSRKWHIQWYRT